MTDKERNVRMTNSEVEKWLADGARHGELREVHYKYVVTDIADAFTRYGYDAGKENEPCYDALIRSNGGEWHEPLIEGEE